MTGNATPALFPIRAISCSLILAALLPAADIAPVHAQTAAAATAASSDQPAPKRKKVIERAAAVMKSLTSYTAKRGERLPALADYYAAKADLAKIDDTAPESETPAHPAPPRSSARRRYFIENRRFVWASAS